VLSAEVPLATVARAAGGYYCGCKSVGAKSSNRTGAENAMSELSNAREELEHAIDRIEAALARRGDDAELQRALQEAQKETRRLRTAADSVSGRLDQAIGRLRATLDSGTEH
jgi:chromosome segregation ATPase